MTRLMTVLAALAFLTFYFLSSASGTEDSGCPPFQPCTASTSCPWYQQNREELVAFGRGTEEYNEIVRLLKKTVCNRGKQKVCCPSDITLNPDGCSVPDESDQESARVECSVEEVPDPVDGFVCKTTCISVSTAFGHFDGRIVKNCRRGHVWNIRRKRCVKSYNRG